MRVFSSDDRRLRNLLRCPFSGARRFPWGSWGSSGYTPKPIWRNAYTYTPTSSDRTSTHSSERESCRSSSNGQGLLRQYRNGQPDLHYGCPGTILDCAALLCGGGRTHNGTVYRMHATRSNANAVSAGVHFTATTATACAGG